MSPLNSYRVDIVVPVYNEAENFSRFYETVCALVKADWRLLMVYDFPEDATLPIATPITERDARVQCIRNSGRGALKAIVTGLRAAEAEAVLTMMVDDPPSVISVIDAMVTVFYEQNATVVSASRYMPGGSSAGSPFFKGLLSRVAGVSLNILIGLPTRDATYNTRLYRKSFLDRMVIESTKGFEVSLELTLKAYLLGERIAEVPVAWSERTVGTSRFRVLEWLPAYLRWWWYGIKTYYFRGAWKKIRRTP